MEMAEIPKLDSNFSASSREAFESEQNKGTQKISVSDHINAFQCSPEKSDSFVIDMETFSSTINKENNYNSRLNLQRSLSRKGSQRGGDKKINGNTALHDRDSVPTTGSPKGALVGSCTPEKLGMGTVGSTDHCTNPQVHHQITITASNISSAAASTATESKCVSRRNSFRRPSFWVLDPKRVLLFFATLSSMGTMLLIYFTLAMSKQNDEYGGDWQQ